MGMRQQLETAGVAMRNGKEGVLLDMQDRSSSSSSAGGSPVVTPDESRFGGKTVAWADLRQQQAYTPPSVVQQRSQSPASITGYVQSSSPTLTTVHAENQDGTAVFRKNERSASWRNSPSRPDTPPTILDKIKIASVPTAAVPSKAFNGVFGNRITATKTSSPDATPAATGIMGRNGGGIMSKSDWVHKGSPNVGREFPSSSTFARDEPPHLDGTQSAHAAPALIEEDNRSDTASERSSIRSRSLSAHSGTASKNGELEESPPTSFEGQFVVPATTLKDCESPYGVKLVDGQGQNR